MAGIFDDVLGPAPAQGTAPATPDPTQSGAPATSAGIFDDVLGPAQSASSNAPAQAPQPGLLDWIDSFGNADSAKKAASTRALLADYSAKDMALYSADPIAAVKNDAAGMVSPVPGMVRGLPFGDRAEAGIKTLASGGAYADNLQGIRDTAANNPTESAENVAGGVLTSLLPVGALGNAASLAGKVGIGALTGGAIGGLYGASATTDLSQSYTQDAWNAAKGAGMGAVVGGAIPIAGAAAGAVAQKAAGYFRPQVGDLGATANSLLYRALNPDGAAAVKQNLDKLGPQANLMDVSEGARSLGQGVSGELGLDNAAIASPLAARAAGTNTRLASDVNAAVGPAPPSAQIASDALEAQKAPYSAALGQAFKAAPPVDVAPILTKLDNIAAADGTPLQSTIATIKRSLTQDAPAAAIPQLPANPTAAQYQSWLAATNAAPQGVQRIPLTDAETLDRARQAIDGMLNWGPRGVGPLAGADATAQGIVGDLRTQLSGALKSQVPGYEPAIDGLASLNKQQQAILDGTKALGGGQAAINPNDFAVGYGPAAVGPTQPGMLPPRTPVQAAQNVGMRAKIADAVGTSPSDFSALKVLLQGADDPASGIGAGYNSKNIGQAFGPQAESTLQSAIDRENAFANTNTAITGNSLTAKRQAMADALKEATANKPLLDGRLSDTHLHGILMEGAKNAINRVASPFQGHVDAPTVYNNLARALTATGPTRNQMLADAMTSGANTMKNKAVGDRTAYIAVLAQALGAEGTVAALSSNARRSAQP